MALGNIIYTPKTYISKSDVVDNLTSNITNLPLSSNQGNVLNTKIEEQFNTSGYAYQDSSIDLNHITKVGFSKDLYSSDVNPNSPKGIGLFYLFVFAYGHSNFRQIAISYTNDTQIALRYNYNDYWSDWTFLVTKDKLDDYLCSSNYMEFKSIGWYRIAKLEGNKDESSMLGGDSYSMMLMCKTERYTTDNMSFTAILNVSYNTSNFTILGKSGSGQITQIRHVSDGTDSYLEVYYNQNRTNYIGLNILFSKSIYQKWVFLDNPQLVTTEPKILFSNADLSTNDRNILLKRDIPTSYFQLYDSNHDGNPINTIKNNWNTLPDGYYICELSIGSVYSLLVQKVNGGRYGSVFMTSYSYKRPVYLIMNDYSWTQIEI